MNSSGLVVHIVVVSTVVFLQVIVSPSITFISNNGPGRGTNFNVNQSAQWQDTFRLINYNSLQVFLYTYHATPGPVTVYQIHILILLLAF